MNWINIAGVAGIIFFICFLGWFILHPISRDKVLVKFGWKYFILLVGIILSSVSVIAWRITKYNDTCTCQETIVTSQTVVDKPWLTAMQYCVKMRDAEGDKLSGGTIFAIMLFQIIVFEGLVIAAIVGWTSRRTKRFQKGHVRYGKLALKGIIRCKNYAVVIGANEVAASVIKNLLKSKDEKQSLDYANEKENQYVILQTSSEIGEVRQTLRAYLTEEEYSRVIIYSDIRYSYEGLKALHLDGASEIYVLGENTTIDGGETYHDTMNMRCVNLIADILTPKRIKRLKNRIVKLDKVLAEENKKTLKENNKIEKLEKRKSTANNKLEKKRRKLEKKKRVCKVLFEYQTTFSIFQFSDVPDNVHYAMHFIPFNRYESWARRVMVDNKALALVDENTQQTKQEDNFITYTPLDGKNGIKPNDTQRVHFIVVGMSKMGVAMGTQALFQAHYPNYVRDNSLKSRITFIDANAEQEMQFFKGRYATLFELARHRYIDAKECKGALLNSGYKWIDPMLDPKTKWKHLSAEGANFLDVEIEFVKGELESEKVREYLRQVTADKNSKVTIAICLPLTHQSVAAALYMPLEVYDNVQEIWVYQREAADIITNLEHARETNKRYERLRPFGMLYGEYIDRRTHYLKALLVNSIYDMDGVNYKKNERNLIRKETYKDLRDSWNDLTVALQWSNKYFADSMYQKLRSMSKNEDCQDIMARCEHNRWNVQQLLLGFSPADEKKLEELAKLNAALDADAREQRSNWREKIGWNRMEPLQQKRAKEDREYKLLPHGQYDEKKNELKHGLYHIHPNIIHYDLLYIYDSGAKDYDEKLNNGIPDILQMVDGYHCSTQQ